MVSTSMITSFLLNKLPTSITANNKEYYLQMGKLKDNKNSYWYVEYINNGKVYFYSAHFSLLKCIWLTFKKCRNHENRF